MIYEPQAYTTRFINHANHRRVILKIARFLVAIAYVNTHWQCLCQLNRNKKKMIFQKKGVKQMALSLDIGVSIWYNTTITERGKVMNYHLGQVVKTEPNQLTDSSYFLITKLDRDNEMYEIEDGQNTYFAWDDVLSSVDTTEFLNAIQTNQLTNEMIIKAWLKNQDQYS